MSTPATDWIQNGRGQRPTSAWTYRANSQLQGLDLGLESGEIALATDDGRMHLLQPDGVPRQPPQPLGVQAALDWADAVGGGIVQLGPSNAAWIDRDLQIQWTVEVQSTILDVATSPFGNAIAISLADAHTFILDSQQQRCGEFTTLQPLQHLQLVPQRRALIGASASGVLCSHRLDGSERWSEKIWANIGALSVNGSGRRILLAASNHGIQCFTARGQSRGFYDIEGTVHLVSTSYVGTILVAATVEQRVYLLDLNGSILWEAAVPEPLVALRCGPLGEQVICGFASGLVQCLRWPAWPRHQPQIKGD